MIKTFIFVEDGSVDLDELKSSVGDDVLVISYRQGATPPAIQQPREPVSEWNDKSYSETKKVLERILDGDYKMSKKLRKELDDLYLEYYVIKKQMINIDNITYEQAVQIAKILNIEVEE